VVERKKKLCCTPPVASTTDRPRGDRDFARYQVSARRACGMALHKPHIEHLRAMKHVHGAPHARRGRIAPGMPRAKGAVRFWPTRIKLRETLRPRPSDWRAILLTRGQRARPAPRLVDDVQADLREAVNIPSRASKYPALDGVIKTAGTRCHHLSDNLPGCYAAWAAD